VFMLLDKQSNKLKMKYIVSKQSENITLNTSYSINENNLLTLCLRKQKPLYVHSDNATKYVAYFPEQFSKNNSNNTCFVIPVVVNHHAIGLFYLDQGKNKLPLDNNHYKYCRHICHKLETALEYKHQQKTDSEHKNVA